MTAEDRSFYTAMLRVSSFCPRKSKKQRMAANIGNIQVGTPTDAK